MKDKDKIGLIALAVIFSSTVYYFSLDGLWHTFLFTINIFGTGYIASRFQKLNDALQKGDEQ